MFQANEPDRKLLLVDLGLQGLGVGGYFGVDAGVVGFGAAFAPRDGGQQAAVEDEGAAGVALAGVAGAVEVTGADVGGGGVPVADVLLVRQAGRVAEVGNGDLQ